MAYLFHSSFFFLLSSLPLFWNRCVLSVCNFFIFLFFYLFYYYIEIVWKKKFVFCLEFARKSIFQMAMIEFSDRIYMNKKVAKLLSFVMWMLNTLELNVRKRSQFFLANFLLIKVHQNKFNRMFRLTFADLFSAQQTFMQIDIDYINRETNVFVSYSQNICRAYSPKWRNKTSEKYLQALFLFFASITVCNIVNELTKLFNDKSQPI